MRYLRLVTGVLVMACWPVPAGATTFPPVTFTELVTRAEVIFVGEVIDVRPFPVDTREGTIIKTRVTFRVSDPMWGTTSALEILEFFGGEWGDIGMAIAEMPKFAVGDRRVVFARRERSINPIVGFTQGLLRISPDSAGVERVFTLDGLPLAGPERIGTARAATVAPMVPMRLSDFRDRIKAALVEARRK
jgi:hypothetical protein